MRHLTFALAIAALGPPVAGAQRVPGRDLVQFPVAALDRPAALGTDLADGLGNPATLVALAGAKLRVGGAALQTPEELSVSAQLLAAAYSLTERTVVGLSAAHWSVDDIAATTTSPDPSDVDVSYRTVMISATAARRNTKHVSVGLAFRARMGSAAGSQRTGLAADAGLFVDSLWRSARLGVASFLWWPGQAEDEQTTIHTAGDLRIWGTSELREARVGVAADFTEPDERLEFLFSSARTGSVSVRLGLARIVRWQAGPWRSRIGAGFHYDKYVVTIAREEGAEGIGPVYQFTLNATYRDR